MIHLVSVSHKSLPSIPAHPLCSAETVRCDLGKNAAHARFSELGFLPAGARHYKRSVRFSASHMPHPRESTTSHPLPMQAILWHDSMESEINVTTRHRPETTYLLLSQFLFLYNETYFSPGKPLRTKSPTDSRYGRDENGIKSPEFLFLSVLTFSAELTEFTVDKNWQTASESKPYKEPELQTTPKETIIQNIKNIITEIKGDTQ